MIDNDFSSGLEDQAVAYVIDKLKAPDSFSPRELATVRAALTYWKREGLMSAGHEQDIASSQGAVEPLSEAEIDDLLGELSGAVE